ncbi:hypothetical protein JCM8547_008156 [Rhodosporidiobolus lusitaniae]
MRAPVETNTLPPDLAARFAALRAPSAAVSSSSRSPTSLPKSTDDDLAARLARLETPKKGDESRIQVGVRTPETRDKEEEDPLVKFLASSSPPSSLPPSSPSRLDTYHHRALPVPSASALDTLSGIEIEFMRPSLGSTVGDLGGEGGGEGEEDDLLKRMRDELELEGRTREREEEAVGEWEKRLEGLRGVVSNSSAATNELGRGRLEDGPPPPTGLGKLEKALRRREKRREKRRGGEQWEETDSDEESDEEEETMSEEEEESTEDEEEEDSEEER